MFKKLLIICFLFISSSAQAVTVTAKIVADDFFSVFVGDSTATSLSLVGGSNGSLWYAQDSFTFDLAADQYIYVAAWDSSYYGPPHMWIGEFVIGGTTLLSNTTDWVSKYSADIKDPNVAQVQALVQSSQSWITPGASMPNGSWPYGSLIEGSAASMIWYDQFSNGVTQNGYALFTNAPVTAPVPEPETYALLGFGLGLMGWIGRRRKLKAS
ncbi:MAG: PEP-CTERM sorting domain-containing protein [Anaerolineales bacterium]|nr:PEP-CTERM sorting domain-containing protein [Anaerolineales bacterium]